MTSMLVFFFFQAEDGIRDLTVTGVQTCALPISIRRSDQASPLSPECGDWQPRRHFRIRRTRHQSHNSNCWWRYFGRTLQARIAIEKPPNVGRESRPVALPYSLHLPTITPSVERAEPARWRPPN